MFSARMWSAALVLAALLFGGCSKSSIPVAPTDPAQAPVSPPITITGLPADGTAVPARFNVAEGDIHGLQAGTAVTQRWEVTRFGHPVYTGPVASSKLVTPGIYTVTLRIKYANGSEADATKSFTLVHSWRALASRSGRYSVVSLSPFEAQGGSYGDSNGYKDDALLILDVLDLGFSYLYHDWVMVEFADGFKIYNRVKRVRFANHMADIFYAIFVSGDADWWSGSMTSNQHWNLGSNSPDRRALFSQHGGVIAVVRIDHPPVNAGDPVVFY